MISYHILILGQIYPYGYSPSVDCEIKNREGGRQKSFHDSKYAGKAVIYIVLSAFIDSIIFTRIYV